MNGRQLAQINVARLVAPLDSPVVAEFVAGLDPVNARADASPGFIWRLQTVDGNATSINMFNDDQVIVNMSVWESAEALFDFVYRGDHAGFLRRRREWFERPDEAMVALWWVPAGHIPTVDEGVRQLERLRAEGPGDEVFTLRQLSGRS